MGKMKFGSGNNQNKKILIPENQFDAQLVNNMLKQHDEVFRKLAEYEGKIPTSDDQKVTVQEYKPFNLRDRKARLHSVLVRSQLNGLSEENKYFNAKIDSLEKELNIAFQGIEALQLPTMPTRVIETVESSYNDSELKLQIKELKSKLEELKSKLEELNNDVYVINEFEKNNRTNEPQIIQQVIQPNNKLVYVGLIISILSLVITFIK